MKPDREVGVRKGRGANWRLAGKWAFAALFLTSGVGHFASTDSFARIVPPSLPSPREIVLASGAIEIALGLLLLVPPTSRLAAWGLVALLIAVFPANVYLYRHQELFPTFPSSGLLHLLRLPFQAVLIYWAYSYTGRANGGERSPEPGPDGTSIR